MDKPNEGAGVDQGNEESNNRPTDGDAGETIEIMKAAEMPLESGGVEEPDALAATTENAEAATPPAPLENAALTNSDGAAITSVGVLTPVSNTAAAADLATSPARSNDSPLATDEASGNSMSTLARDASETVTVPMAKHGANGSHNSYSSFDSPSDAPATDAPVEPAASEVPMEMPVAQQPSSEGEGALPRSSEPLEVGVMVGPYLIERVLHKTPDENTYLAIGIQEDGERGPYVTLVERAEGGFSENVLRFIALRLRHPRLLAPRALFSLNGNAYLVVETLVDEHGEPAQLVSEGGRLPIVNTLTGGAGLADALSFLHRNGVVHLHVSPDTLRVFNGRAYLTGLEQASYLDMNAAEAAALVARDTNFLARTLAVIGGISREEVPDEDLVDDNLRRIAAHGAADGFESPGELAGACSVALESVAHVLPNLSSDTTARIMFETGSATTVGRVRSQNQDACATAMFDLSDDWTQGEPVGIFLVADGMGGEARGELASRIAARMVLAEMTTHFTLPAVTRPALGLDEVSTPAEGLATQAENAAAPTGQGKEQLEETGLTKTLVQAVERANQQVRELAQQLGKVTGTTLTAIAVQGQHAALAHLGDSRAYLLRGDVMVKLTEDHSVLARLQTLDHPLLSDPDMFIPRNTLYRSLGQEEETIPDTLEFTLAPGDRLLICSDGLWDELDPQALAQTLAGASDPRDCTEQLVQMANAAGGNDNSTALAIFVHAVPVDADRLAPADSWEPPSAEN